MLSNQAATPLATAVHTCPALCTHIGLRCLACLATSSKRLLSDIQAVVGGDQVGFLDVALEAARSSKQHQHHQAVAWLAALLLRTAPATAADVTERLLALPAVPLDCTRKLVSAGLRITYPQLLAAASSTVAGVEVWVQAQREMGIETDIPAAAVAICCGDDWAGMELLAQGGGQMLHLAVNCRNSATAAAAARSIPVAAATAEKRLPALLDRDVAHKLLLTAVTRQHSAAVQHMVGLPVMQQHMDAATLEAMIRLALQHEECVEVLCHSPAAAQLSSDAVARLLLAACQEHEYAAAYHFCFLAAARQLSSEQVEALLHALMQAGAVPESRAWEGYADYLNELWDLPGTKQLSSYALVRLLYTAIHVQGNVYTEDLCTFAAADAITSADVTSLLSSAFSASAGVELQRITQDIIHLPAFKLLTSTDIAQLLGTVAEHYSDGDASMRHRQLTSLSEHPAAQELSSEQLLRPLQAAVQRNYLCTEELCALPAAQQLGGDALERLLQATLPGNTCHGWRLLRRLPAAQQLGSKAVSQLLQAAADASNVEGMLFILERPAAAQLNSDVVSSALTAVAECSQHNCTASCLQVICRLPAAAMLDSEQIATALEKALQCRDGISCLNHLLQLPAAAMLSVGQVARLLHSAALHGNAACMEQLCKLSASAQLSSEQLLQALAAAVQRGSCACLEQLVKLPAAKHLSSQALQGLLRTAQLFSSTTHVECTALLHGLMDAAIEKQQADQ